MLRIANLSYFLRGSSSKHSASSIISRRSNEECLFLNLPISAFARSTINNSDKLTVKIVVISAKTLALGVYLPFSHSLIEAELLRPNFFAKSTWSNPPLPEKSQVGGKIIVFFFHSVKTFYKILASCVSEFSLTKESANFSYSGRITSFNSSSKRSIDGYSFVVIALHLESSLPAITA